MHKNRTKLVLTARKSGKPEELCTDECMQTRRLKIPNDYQDDVDEGIRKMKNLQEQNLGSADFDSTLSSNNSLSSSFKLSCSSSRTAQLFHVHENQILKRRNRRLRRLSTIWVGSDEVDVPLFYQDSVTTGNLPPGITVKRFNDLKSTLEKSLLHAQGKSGTPVFDFNSPSEARDNTDDGLFNVPVLTVERDVEGAFSLHNKPCTSKKTHSYAGGKLSIDSVQLCLISKSVEGLFKSTASADSVSCANRSISLNTKVKGHSKYLSLSKNFNSNSPEGEAGIACDGSLSTDTSCQIVLASVDSTSGVHLNGSLEEAFASITNVQDSYIRKKNAMSVYPRCSFLYDVELKVRANYRGQRAPLVSLVSKLNGKAIVGYAVSIDILGYGSDAILMNTSCNVIGCCCNSLTNRANAICKLRERLDCPMKSKVRGKKAYFSCMSSSLLKRKPLDGSKSRSYRRKIRRLSSIAIDLKSREVCREIVAGKAEEVSPVACIPLRVVFGRLNEMLSCCSSHRAS